MFDDKNKIIDIKKLLVIILSKWYIIAGCLLLVLSFTYLKLRYSIPRYTATLKLKYDDERGSQLNDIMRYGRTTGRIENQMRTEAQIIQSRSVAIKTLEAMQDNFTYIIEGNIVTKRLYPNNLFKVHLLYIDSHSTLQPFTLKFLSNNRFEFISSQKTQVYVASDTIFLGNVALSIQLLDKGQNNPFIGIPIHVKQNDIFSTAISYTSLISVEEEKGTSIINLSYTSDIPQFAIDFLNTLAKVYIREQVNTKSQAAEQTLNFISKQLDELSNDVEQSQQNLSDFKSKNKGINPEEIGKKEFEKLVSLESERNVEIIKKNLLDKLIQEVQQASNKPVELLTLDIDDSRSIESFQTMLNNLLLERISLSQRYSAESNMMIENDKKIRNAKEGFLKALYNNKSKLEDKIAFLNKMIADANNQLASLPSKQQSLINLERNYKVNEKIFSYLLEKRLETMLNRASIIPNTSVIDEAVSAAKVYPNEKKNYVLALVVALMASTVIIALLRVIHDRIPDKETIESLSKIPVIGVIKKIDTDSMESNYNIHALSSPKSVFSESIRGIRTNINFLLGGETHKIISLTSTVSGEGKTFCTLNLAASLTLLNYKVVIIGCDLRRPKLHLSFNTMDNRMGLTSYLFGKHQKEEIIKTTEYPNLFIIPAGPVPPNPSELLQSEKMTNLLNELKQDFDYIFLDNSPVGLVSDSLTLMKIADINLFIIRAQYSKRDFALVPDRLKSDNEIKNLYTILNSFDTSSIFYSSIYKNEYGGYYGGGGYYYGGYYGKNSYSYYGKRYASSYYSGYYAEDDIHGKRKNLITRIKTLFTQRNKKA